MLRLKKVTIQGSRGGSPRRRGRAGKLAGRWGSYASRAAPRRSGSAEHASGRRAPGSQWDPGPNIRSGPIRVPFAIEMSQYQLQNVTHIWGKCHGTYAGASKGIEDWRFTWRVPTAADAA